jgi:hypothetical protein
MDLPVTRQPSRLPKRFPVGTTYVVEGRSGEDGHLSVSSRYVVLPGGRRINIPADLGGSASPYARRPRNPAANQSQKPAERGSRRSKNFLVGAGTTG